jgi:hypothetical protein
MTDFSTTVIKLAADGSNWITYKDRLTWTITSQRWSTHLTSATVTQQYINASNVNGMTPHERWEDEENQVKQLIAVSLPDQVFNVVKVKANVFEIWEEIKNLHQKQSKMIIVDLGKELQRTQLGEDDDARAHFAKLIRLCEQLASMGKTYDDDEFSSILLGSLPPVYDHIVGGMNATADSTGNPITTSQVIRLIGDEYDRRVIRRGGKKNGADEAFTANSQKMDARNIECYNCHKLGHYKSDCWAKGGGKEGQHLPQKNDNDNRNNDNRNDNRQENRGNRGRNNDNSNSGNRNNRNTNNRNDNCNESASTAADDFGAWAAIKEIDKDIPSTYIPIPDTAYTAPIVRPPEIEVELYDSGASKHMSPF